MPSHATNVGTWTVRDLDPLESWANGRAILIGDAAHPMFPRQWPLLVCERLKILTTALLDQASAGAMAIEDAEGSSLHICDDHQATN